MNYAKLFSKAKELGISSVISTKNSGSSTEISLFRGEITNFSKNSSFSYAVRGVYNDKFGSVITEVEDVDFILNSIVESAKINEKEEKAEIFEGSKSYKKRNYYNPKLDEWSLDDKIANLYAIERKLKESDNRVQECEVSYSEELSDTEIRNSYGLKLKNKTNYYVYSASCVVNDNGETKEGYYLFFSNKPEDFKIDDFVKELLNNALSQLGGKTIKSKKYKCVLSDKATSSLLGAYIDWASAEEVQKKSSKFIGKLNKKVANSKITIYEKPLMKNIFGRGFDDEGVATCDKKIIDRGVLKTFFYNLETAKKDGVESTGNGYGVSKIGVGYSNIVLKPGKKSEEELISKVGDGIYIQSVTGLHAGLNRQSGNFSLQAVGFVIENGKIGDPLKMITVAGNLYDLFNDVSAIANNTKLHLSSMITPSIVIKKLSIASE